MSNPSKHRPGHWSILQTSNSSRNWIESAHWYQIEHIWYCLAGFKSDTGYL